MVMSLDFILLTESKYKNMIKTKDKTIYIFMMDKGVLIDWIIR